MDNKVFNCHWCTVQTWRYLVCYKLCICKPSDPTFKFSKTQMNESAKMRANFLAHTVKCAVTFHILSMWHADTGSLQGSVLINTHLEFKKKKECFFIYFLLFCWSYMNLLYSSGGFIFRVGVSWSSHYHESPSLLATVHSKLKHMAIV